MCGHVKLTKGLFFLVVRRVRDEVFELLFLGGSGRWWNVSPRATKSGRHDELDVETVCVLTINSGERLSMGGESSQGRRCNNLGEAGTVGSNQRVRSIT